MDYLYPIIGIFLNLCLLSLACICVRRRNQRNRNNNLSSQVEEPFILTHHYAIPIQFYPQPTAPQPTAPLPTAPLPTAPQSTAPLPTAPPLTTSITRSLPYDNSNQLYTIYENEDKGNPVNY